MAKAHSVFVRLVLPPYTIHFKSAGYMKDVTLDMLDKKVCKEMLRRTANDAAAREAVGLDVKFWEELCTLLKAAIPSLERRSFTIWDPSSVDYESTSGALIASHYPALWKDLERLNDLVSISRNVLTVGDRVQDLAASFSIDAEVFRLINCCVRVTARGYDGDAGTGDEEKWQWIVNAYKKLLITSLQFLNNLVAQNERRKLMLWVSLFDNTTETVLGPEDVPETSSASLTDVPSNPTSKPPHPLSSEDFLIAYGTNGVEEVSTVDAQPLWDSTPFSDYPLPKEALEGREKLERRERFDGNGYALFVKRLKDLQIEDYHIERKRKPNYGEAHLEFPRRWAEISDDDHEYWQGLFDDAMAKYRQDLAVYEAKMIAVTETQPVLRSDVPVAEQTRQVERKIAMLEEQLAEKYRSENADIAPLEPPVYGQDGHLTFDNESLQSRPVVADDMRMLFTADAGTKILESGKSELMKRLEGYDIGPHIDLLSPLSPRSGPIDAVSSTPLQEPQTDGLPELVSNSRGSPAASTAESSIIEDVPRGDEPSDEAFDESAGEDDIEEGSQEAEEEEEDYPGSTEDGRGLLTDVPLILGPSEIEVLPMLIMSGIVPPITLPAVLSNDERNALMNMHTVRTHLLLSQSNGRNLLRELLIFVAAWDLREEELYFKFMVKIMEAILKNGLMPYAYHAFRDRSRSKDIISPAQAVIMKLLTCIFRARGDAAKQSVAANAQGRPAPTTGHTLTHAVMPSHVRNNAPALTNMPSRVDLHILNFIFTEFRQHIIPQTCALIFLQGQIHAGRASPEDFPLNLWDMERMYEGVYQYLEFFAVLTEEGVWKGILGEWEMASELVTLLRELEGGIPKMGSVIPQVPRRVSSNPPQRAMSVDAGTLHHNAKMAPQSAPGHYASSGQGVGVAKQPTPAPVAVERPFDVAASDSNLPPLPLHPATNGTGPVFESDTPLAFSDDNLPSLAQDLQHDQDEPSDFEWRNLKKLTVLVLSSLIWKNRTVQDQVRKYGGLEALVGCCRPDEHNPYIREHAIMCLRFAVEGCEENSQVIKRMASTPAPKAVEGGSITLSEKEDVPSEILDEKSYETFMDSKGQVGLRPKQGATQAAAQSPAAALSSNTSSIANAGVQKPRIGSTKLTAERAAELMSSALSSLPLGERMINDKQKADALAKLDRAFESTERVLGARGRRG
ncbi:putative armadillo-like helical, Ataxin-10 domain-containing protein [Septoria linicola]|nr:putative armadillo-like helical, Ataxin-10 domain-containing protein [Septoria linicola]